MTELEKLSKAVKAMREYYGWTQSDLAELAELDTTQISFLERGTRAPTFRTLERVAKAGHISIARLMALGEPSGGDSAQAQVGQEREPTYAPTA